MPCVHGPAAGRRWPPRGAGLSTHTDHILVVDDDADIRQLVGDSLRRNGLRVSQAADGREMRATLETCDVDLIVLD
ncbi:response regulator, partial [Stenotrophomonas sp. SrG]|uniref:response regulator n=1 Tax=Stenotrophomonas sp. SrG TaxID=3414430 RepID=UPI003CE9BCD2